MYHNDKLPFSFTRKNINCLRNDIYFFMILLYIFLYGYTRVEIIIIIIV